MTHRTPLFTLVLALCLAGCSRQPEDQSEGQSIRSVEVAEVERASLERIVSADGILRALDQSAITPKISAPVNRFLVNRGDHVARNQVVAVLESRDLSAAVSDSKGAYDQAQAQYRNTSAASVPDEVAKAQADVAAARQTMDAAQRLLASRQQLLEEGALARRLVDEAAVTFAQAKSQFDTALRHLESVESVSRRETVNSAAAQVDSARARFEAAQAQLSYAEIRSPIAGVVAERPLFAGEMAVPGTPLMLVMDVSSVIARVSVPQAQARWVKVGQPARIVSAEGATQAPGKVTVVSPALDPQGTTVEVWVQAVNPGERLRPGEAVRVTFTADTVRNATLVPSEALLPSSEGGTAVLVVGPDMLAHEHKVTTGIRGAKVQILDGVEPGMRVVVAGGLGLQDGAKVQIGERQTKDGK